jgi:deferrochelatase/peroxidase EfeB
MKLSRSDALNEYITHTGTALFACPAGLREGDSSAYWGSTLLS